MKCKKIFALLLSLCMVMSTFVVVANAATETVTVTMSADFDAESDDVAVGPAVTGEAGATVGDASGVMEITANAQDTWSGQNNTSAWGIVGFVVVDENGDPITYNDLMGWDTLEYSVDIMVPDMTKVASPKLVVRAWKAGDATPSGTNVTIDNLSGLESNVWKTFEGSADIDSYTWQQQGEHADQPLCFFVRAQLKEEGAKMYMEDLTLTLTKTVTVEDEEPELPPEGEGFTMGEPHSSIVDNGDGSYTANMSAFSQLDAIAVNDSTPLVRIIPETPLSLDDEWTITIDATTSGLQDSDGITSTKLRLFDNTTGSTMANTLGWVTADNASTADGTITMVFTSDNYSQAGNSTADEIQSISLCYNLAGAYGTTTGSVTFDNITFEYGLPESEEPELPPVTPDEPELPPVTPDGPSDDDDEITDEVSYVAVVDSSNDFEEDMGDVLVGNTAVEGELVTLGDRNVLKVTATGTTNHTGLVAIQLADAEGHPVLIKDLKEYDRVTFSADIMMEDKSALPSNANGAFLALRYGGWTPTYAQASLANLGGNTLTNGQWKTISGSYLVKDIPWQATNFDGGSVYYYIRPNFTGAAVMYVDNMSIKVEKEFVPTILEVTEVSVGADNVTLNVETDDVIDIDSLADYILVDGVAVNADNVTAEAVDATNTKVTIVGLAPGSEYTIEVTGALNSRDREVAVAEGEGTIDIVTIAEVDATADLTRDGFTYSLTNNLADTEDIYVVLLRCKGNTVIETTVGTQITVESGENAEGTIEVPELEDGEYYRFFTWSYMESGAVNSMANLIDLD